MQMKNFIECFILKNEKWEDITKYYYSKKYEIDITDFIKYINVQENIDIKLNNEKYNGYDMITSFGDFDNFHQKCISNDKIEDVKVIENEWNYKLIFMATINYYIIIQWETSA